MPRPSPRSVKRFAAELATIVLGVLISIGFAQAVEQAHWAGEVRDSREALSTEIADNNEYFAFRVAAADCLERRVDQLEAVIERAARAERQPPVKPFRHRASQGLRDDRWEAERAAQSLTHFDKAEYFRFAAYYGLLRDMRPWVEEEVSLWDRLRVLEGDPMRLGPADVAGLRRDLAAARGRNILIARNAGLQVKHGEALGVPAPKVDAQWLQKACEPIVQG